MIKHQAKLAMHITNIVYMYYSTEQYNFEDACL